MRKLKPLTLETLLENSPERKRKIKDYKRDAGFSNRVNSLNGPRTAEMLGSNRHQAHPEGPFSPETADLRSSAGKRARIAAQHRHDLTNPINATPYSQTSLRDKINMDKRRLPNGGVAVRKWP